MRRFLVIWVPIAFGAYFIFTQPKPAAAMVGGFFGGVGHAFSSAIVFLTALFT